jgi:hypothetical protein
MIQILRYHHNSTNQSIISRKPPHRDLTLVLSPSVYRSVKKRDPDPAQEHCPRPISKHLAGVKFKSQEASVSRCLTLFQCRRLGSRPSFSAGRDPHSQHLPQIQMRTPRLSSPSPIGRWYGIRSISATGWVLQVSKLAFFALWVFSLGFEDSSVPLISQSTLHASSLHLDIT